MNLKTFLKLFNLHQIDCVSIYLLLHDHKNSNLIKTYFEKEDWKKIEKSETYKKIWNKQVYHFYTIGGNMYPFHTSDDSMYPVELCIYLTEE